ncbi:uncharacterized protein LOC110713502 [Chenopodium quinoa]|uniref:uncharacterized protein LOC110713502 n=1 Tax=Chenopodium quinoa TaxID=63459 RepID=UPI000B78FFD8|nr:uncharacterized protein LOC110713502 [Chenopodium quinoa]
MSSTPTTSFRRKSNSRANVRVYCGHRLPAAIRTAWKFNENQGKRFYGCSKWKVDDYKFFEWIDKEDYGPRAIEVINGLVVDNKMMEAELEHLEKNTRTQKQAYEYGVKLRALKDENKTLKQQLKAMSGRERGYISVRMELVPFLGLPLPLCGSEATFCLANADLVVHVNFWVLLAKFQGIWGFVARHFHKVENKNQSLIASCRFLVESYISLVVLDKPKFIKEDEHGQKKSLLALWIKTHAGKDGKFLPDTVTQDFVDDIKAKVEELRMVHPKMSEQELEDEAFQQTMYGNEIPDCSVGYRLGVKKGDIYGVRGVLRKEGYGKVQKRTIVMDSVKEEVNALHKKNDTLSQENEKLKDEVGHNNLLLKALVGQFSQIVGAVRQGNASPGLLNKASEFLGKAKHQIGKGNVGATRE